MTAKDYLRNLVTKIDPEDLKGVTSNIHFELNDEKYTIALNNGKAEFKEGLIGSAEVNLKTSPENLVKIASKQMNPMTAMMLGKLKISNPGAMMKYAKMLGLM